MNTPLKVLLVEDSEDDAVLLIRELRNGGYEPEYRRVENADSLIAALETEHWDLVITDYSLPGFSGLAALDILNKQARYVPAIMISGKMGENAAVEAMKAGANDYIVKGNYNRLIPAIERELREAEVHRERQATQEALQRSEARYRAVVEDQTEMINRYTLDGVITFVNWAYANLYGKTPDEMVGLKHEDFLDADSHRKFLASRSKLSKEHPFSTNEHLHVMPDGQQVWLQWLDRLILDEEGKPIECQGVGRDITDIKQAERELKIFAGDLERYANQLQVAAEIARDAAAAHDLDSLLKRAVDLVNERFGFYHAAIFLLDDSGDYAVLTSASGNGGAKLLQQGHKLKVGVVGIVGHVALTGQPRIALDVGKDSVHFKQPLLSQTRSEMSVPLKVTDRVIGVFDVQSQKASAFDGNDLIVLQTLADQLAIAIDNIRLVQETQQRSHELSSLYEAALATSSELETEQLLQRLYEQVQQLIVPDSFMIALCEPNSDQFTIAVAMENGEPVPQFLGKTYPFSAGGLTGWVMKEGRPLLIGDILDDPTPVEPITDEEPTRSWLGVPLMARDRLIGAVSVQSFQPRAFSISSQRFLESLTAQAAVSIENARLFGAERAAREQAESLREVAQVVGASLEPQEILELILGQLKRVLVFDTASVILFEEDHQSDFMAVIGYQDLELVRSRSGDFLKDSPILAQMAHDLQPVIIHDVREYPDWIWVPGAEHVRSFIGVPVVKRDKMIGTLMIDSRQTNFYTEDDLKTIQALTQHIGIAIENAQLFEAERIAREKAEALREAAHVIGSTLSLDQVIEAVLEQLERVLSYDTACVIMVEGNLARVRAGRGYEKFSEAKKLSAVTLPKDAVVIQEVVGKSKVLMIPDVRDFPGWVVTSFSEHVRAYLGIPLRVRDQVIGFFSIDSVTPGSFTENDIEIGQIFAAQTSAAIENARLFETQEKRANELEILRQVSLGLTASLKPESVFDAVLEGAFKLIPTIQDAHIFTFDNDRLTFGSALWYDGRRGEMFAAPRPGGLTDTTARSGEMVLVDDMQSHPICADVTDKEDWVGSIVGMPVKIGQRVVGVLNVAHPETNAFSDVDLRLLRLLADQAALAIENARLFEQTTTERRHIALLYDVGQTLATTLEPATILERALELVCPAFGGHVGAAWIYLHDQEYLFMCALYSHGILPLDDLNPENELRMDLGVGVVGWAAQEMKPVIEPDVRKNQYWTEIPYVDEDVRALIASPITEGQNLLGALAILHPQVAGFSSDQMDLFQTICQQVGLALSNARRYQDINRLVDLLAAEQYRLESLIEMLPVGVLLLDENQRLLVTNPLGRKWLGVLVPDLEDNLLTDLGNVPLSELFAHQDDPLPVEIAVEGPRPGVFEVQARSIGGETLQWVLTLRDVTQEREIQDRIQMQNRLATVGQLAAGIAHDFNNIMAAIVVYADLLMMEPTLSDASQDRLSTIQQQVQRASSLIRQILDFSRRSVMEQSALDLLPFLKEMEKLLERTLPETVRLELVYEDGKYQVMADPTRLQQVLMNLAVNARDAMMDGGNLRFELGSIFIEPDEKTPVMDMPTGNWIKISVIDSGVGIAAENLSHIFEPFFTTKPVGQGTGLGLAQVYGIVRQHEGYIDVNSQVGEGTQFDIYLPPLPTDMDEDDIQDDHSLLDGTGKTVLVVEDDATTLTALQALLDAHRFRVLIASNGTEALEVLEKSSTSISLVISDIVMPEMGGMDLYTVMKIRWPEIKMVFITGHPMDSQDQDVLERGRVTWLQKPFSIIEFNRALKKVFA